MKMKTSWLLKTAAGILIVAMVAFGLIGLKHPIIFKWLTGSARNIGQPIRATVYANGRSTPDFKVFHVTRNWDKSNLANIYLLNIPDDTKMGKLKFISINLNENWVVSLFEICIFEKAKIRRQPGN